MSTNKEYYNTYANEVYALYSSFRLAGFDDNYAFELTKICVTNQCTNNSFYAELDRKRRSDRLKASLNNLKSCEEKEKNHGKIQWSPWDNHV